MADTTRNIEIQIDADMSAFRSALAQATGEAKKAADGANHTSQPTHSFSTSADRYSRCQLQPFTSPPISIWPSR